MIGRFREQGAVHDGGQFGRFRNEHVHEEFIVWNRLDETMQRESRPGKSPRFAGRQVSGRFQRHLQIGQMLGLDEQIDVLGETRLRMERHGDSADQSVRNLTFSEIPRQPLEFPEHIHGAPTP